MGIAEKMGLNKRFENLQPATTFNHNDNLAPPIMTDEELN